MQPVGIEPTSTVLQTAAMTTSARVAWCLWQDSNLHTVAYLATALTRYKLASLPLSYRGMIGVLDGERSHTIAFTEQCADHYTTNTIELAPLDGIEPPSPRS